MQFKNETGKAHKVKRKDNSEPRNYRWITVKEGEMIELDASIGYYLNFTPLKGTRDEDAKDEEEGNSSKGKLEEYKKKLLSILGLGPKTARDIIQVYPTEKSLKKAVKAGEELAVRDDLIKPLGKRFKK